MVHISQHVINTKKESRLRSTLLFCHILENPLHYIEKPKGEICMTTNGKQEALKLEKIYVKTKRIGSKIKRLIDKGLLTDEMAEIIRSQITSGLINEVIFYDGFEDIEVFQKEVSNKTIMTHNMPGDKYIEVSIEILEGDYTPESESISIYKRTDRLGKDLEDVVNHGTHAVHDKPDYNKPIIAIASHTMHMRLQEEPKYRHAEHVGEWKDLHVYYPNKQYVGIKEGENK